MTDTTKKVLIGCGIGCGVILMIFVLLCGTGIFLVKDSIKSFKETEATQQELEARFGAAEDYCPPADGRIPSDRIDAFLYVRENMDSLRADMEQGIDEFTQDVQGVQGTEKPFWKILGLVKKGFDALPGLAHYYAVRNQTLMEAGMGLGEYQYLYITAYYAYLGHAPADGPDFQMFGSDDHGRGFELGGEDQGKIEEVRAEREEEITLKVRQLFMAWLDCQIKSAAEFGAWRRTLVRELDALEQDRTRLVWSDGLPSVIRQSLEPYHDRLEASYSPLLNPFEIYPEKN